MAEPANRHRRGVAFAVVAALAAVACEGGSGDAGYPAVDPGQPRYEASGIVVQAKGQGPELCVGAQNLNLPPTCRGFPLVGWSWAAVAGEQSRGGTTWGEYLLRGAFDGSTFTLTEAPLPPLPAPAPEPLRSACPEPPDGYADRVPAQATPDRLDRAVALARAHPTLGGLWIHEAHPPAPDPSRQARGGQRRSMVLNVSFTADLDARRAELEATWGGFVCVTEAEHRLADLQRVQSDLVAAPPPGLKLLGAGVREVENRVWLWVVVSPLGTQEALDARFGPGTVLLESAMRPLP